MIVIIKGKTKQQMILLLNGLPFRDICLIKMIKSDINIKNWWDGVLSAYGVNDLYNYF